MAIGAPGVGSSAGAVYVFYGPRLGPLAPADADVVFLGEEAGDSAGWSVAIVPDTGDDGIDDLLEMTDDDAEEIIQSSGMPRLKARRFIKALAKLGAPVGPPTE